jgi:hypothetical protein
MAKIEYDWLSEDGLKAGARLRELWLTEMEARDIAKILRKEFRYAFTRHMIIGWKNRNGLESRPVSLPVGIERKPIPTVEQRNAVLKAIMRSLITYE